MQYDVKFIKDQLTAHFKNVFEKSLINEISKNGIYKTYEKGEMLLDIGDEMTHIPLILKGLVKVLREDQHEDEILLYFLEEGDTCAISFVLIKAKVFSGLLLKKIQNVFYFQSRKLKNGS